MPTYKETVDARHEAMEALEHAKLRAAVVAYESPPTEAVCAALAILGRDPLASAQDLDTLTPSEVLAPYVERKDVEASVSHGAILIRSDRRELDVSHDDGGWWALCSWISGASEPVRVVTRADLDAHVSWVAGEAG